MHSVFLESIDKNKAILSSSEVHHLVRVRRAKHGDSFLGLDGKGKVYLCHLELEKGKWFGQIVNELKSEKESHLRIILGQSLIKKVKFEWLIQKATELGVVEVVPLLTSRTQIRSKNLKAKKELDRWKRISIEAVKQSGRSSVPEISAAVSLEKFLATRPAPLRFFLDEEQGMPLGVLIDRDRSVDSCVVVVGPEGGWDEDDRRIFHKHHLSAVHLGPRTLRGETVPLVILSILQYELGDLCQ